MENRGVGYEGEARKSGGRAVYIAPGRARIFVLSRIHLPAVRYARLADGRPGALIFLRRGFDLRDQLLEIALHCRVESDVRACRRD